MVAHYCMKFNQIVVSSISCSFPDFFCKKRSPRGLDPPLNWANIGKIRTSSFLLGLVSFKIKIIYNVVIILELKIKFESVSGLLCLHQYFSIYLLVMFWNMQATVNLPSEYYIMSQACTLALKYLNCNVWKIIIKMEKENYLKKLKMNGMNSRNKYSYLQR